MVRQIISTFILSPKLRNDNSLKTIAACEQIYDKNKAGL